MSSGEHAPVTRGVPAADAEHLRYALRHVLAGLALPAQRWQILTHAADWGAPASLRARLAALPEGTYRTHEAILTMLTGRPRPPA